MPDAARAIAVAFVALVVFMLGGALATAGAPRLLAIGGAVLLTVWAIHVLYRPPERRRERREHGLCVACGYDLTGNVSGVCPECGEGAGGRA